MRTIPTLALALALLLGPTALLAADSTPAPTCEQRPFKEVKTVTPFSLTHRPKAKTILFDDIACGLKWRKKQCSSIQADFDSAAKVYDYHTQAEILISQATFVQAPDLASPMGSGLAAFATPADADQFLSQHRQGKRLSYQELLLLELP